MKSHKFLIRCLLASAFFGVFALMIDQTAIQQEGGIRKLQSENYQLEIKNGLIENYFSHLASVEVTSAEMYSSVFARYLIIDREDYQFFVDKEKLKTNCNNSLEGAGCYTFTDDLENLKKDILSYIKIARDNIFDDYVSLVIRTGEQEGTREHIDNFTKQLLESEQRILKITTETNQNKIYADLDFFLNSINQNIFKLRDALQVASNKLHKKSIDQKALISNKMSSKQRLLLIGVFLQISSLVALLFFFRILLRTIKELNASKDQASLSKYRNWP